MASQSVRIARKSSILLLLTIGIAGQSGPCPIFGSRTISRSGTVTLTTASFDTEHYEDFENPAAPEQNFTVMLTYTSPDAILPDDAFAEIGFNCGLTGSFSYQVPLASSGLTTLTSSVARDAKNICIDSNSGQRQPAYWYLRVGRVANQQVTVQWEVSYTPYLGIGQ